ncbi:hypothetical protein VNO77_03116 [Canavalia gladiata]|uniref:Uncharacterized protein n=1 Tax=Canavalia gladiata TaxID=3824 RepID=A0AAN9R3J9_CANGL
MHERGGGDHWRIRWRRLERLQGKSKIEERSPQEKKKEERGKISANLRRGTSSQSWIVHSPSMSNPSQGSHKFLCNVLAEEKRSVGRFLHVAGFWHDWQHVEDADITLLDFLNLVADNCTNKSVWFDQFSTLSSARGCRF